MRTLAARILGNRVAIGGLVVGSLVALTVIVFGGFLQRALQRKGEKVSAVFRDTGMLAKDAPVRVHGVNQGRVEDLRLNPDGRTTTVVMTVFGDALPLYRNATAAVKFRNVLGGNDQVEIDPGSPAAGRNGSMRIGLAHTSGQVEVDQILSAIRDPERRGLKTMLREVPSALADPAAPAHALRTLADRAPDLTRGLSAARGERDGDLRALVRNAASTVNALDDDPRQLTDLVTGAAGTLDTTARRRADIQATIGRASTVLPDVRRTLTRLDVTLAGANGLLDRLTGPAGAVGPTLHQLRPAVLDTGGLLDQAQPLLAALRPAASSLRSASRAGRPLLDELDPSLRRLADSILPDLAKPDPTTKRATYEMVGPTLAGLNAAGASFDQVGHMVSLGAGGGERAVATAPCRTYFTDPTAKQLVECQSLAETFQRILSYQPLTPSPPKEPSRP